jgi:phosphoglycerate kinase
MDLPKIQNAGDLAGKRVLLRLDLNVPIQDGKIKDDFRLKKATATLDYLRQKQAKVIIISHSESGLSHSLRPVFEYLSKSHVMRFVPDFTSHEGAQILKDMQTDEVVMIENIRQYHGEMENDPAFAKSLAMFADMYVNDAFSVSHREHSSIVGLPKLLPSYSGLLFQKEVEELSKVLNPPHPFLFIIGGAKFRTKEPVIKKYLEIANFVFVGGALAHPIWKSMGYEMGDSALPDGDIKLDLDFTKNNDKLFLPVDASVETADGLVSKNPNQVRPGEIISDAGPLTLRKLAALIKVSKFIVWNGPLGNYEKGFKAGTLELARLIIESGVQSIVGGGDTLAVVDELQAEDKFSFVSTAGGALLDFLAQGGTLPGIEALLESAKR